MVAHLPSTINVYVCGMGALSLNANASAALSLDLIHYVRVLTETELRLIWSGRRRVTRSDWMLNSLS